MRMRTSHKLKIQENIASMSLTILVVDFQIGKEGLKFLSDAQEKIK